VFLSIRKLTILLNWTKKLQCRTQPTLRCNRKDERRDDCFCHLRQCMSSHDAQRAGAYWSRQKRESARCHGIDAQDSYVTEATRDGLRLKAQARILTIDDVVVRSRKHSTCLWPVSAWDQLHYCVRLSVYFTLQNNRISHAAWKLYMYIFIIFLLYLYYHLWWIKLCVKFELFAAISWKECKTFSNFMLC